MPNMRPDFLLCCSRKRSFLIKTVHTPLQSRTHTQRREERGSHNYRLAHPVTLTSTTWRFITAWVDSPSFRVECLLTSKLGDCDSWNIMQTIILRRPRGLEKFHCHNPLFLQMLGHYTAEIVLPPGITSCNRWFVYLVLRLTNVQSQTVTMFTNKVMSNAD